MASINNTTNSSTPLSQPAPVRTQASEQRTNVEPAFSHVVMPESSSLSNRSVEQLPSQSSSIPLSVPAFGDLRISHEEEKAFTPSRPVFFDDDLELPSAMPTMVDMALPEVLPSAEDVRGPPTSSTQERREPAESKTQSFSPVRALPEMGFSNQDAIFKIAFGKAKWEKHFGSIGVEPPLPPNIKEILSSPCPFWEDKKVRETHLLTLIPSTVNGIPFNLDLMEQLIQNPSLKYSTSYSFYYPKTKNEYGSRTTSSHWVLMTRDCIPGSINENYDKMNCMIKELQSVGMFYEFPTELEAVTSIVMEYVETGNRLYSLDNYSFTRCRDKVENDRWQQAIGGFSVNGIEINYDADWHEVDSLAGLGCLIRL